MSLFEKVNLKRSRFILLNSKDKSNGTPSNFIINLPQGEGVYNAREIMLKSVSFPHLFPNITSNNNVLDFKHNASDYSVTLPAGQYTVTKLMTDLGALMTTAVGVTITLAQDSFTHLITFTANSGTMSVKSSGSMSGNLGVTSETPTGANTTAQEIPNLYGPTYAYLYSEALGEQSNMLNSRGLSCPIIAEIPITAPFGFQNVYEAEGINLDNIVYNGSNNIQSIDIRIVDESGNELVIPDNHETKIILRTFY